jgi:4'-phosphopantetheinyl transferase
MTNASGRRVSDQNQKYRRYIVARGALRLILARYLAISPARVAFHYGLHGKPSLVSPSPGGALEFNLSHTDDIALYAVTRGIPLGVDVEGIRLDTSCPP